MEELRSSVNLLMANLESQPVAKDFKPKIKPKLTPMNSFLDIGDENDLPLSKSDVVLSFSLEVDISEDAIFALHVTITLVVVMV